MTKAVWYGPAGKKLLHRGRYWRLPGSVGRKEARARASGRGDAKAEGYTETYNPRSTLLAFCVLATLDIGQVVQRTDDFADQVGGDMCVDRRRTRTGVSEQDLDHPQVGACFQQMGGETMPQGINTLLINLVQLGSFIGSTRFLTGRYRSFAGCERERNWRSSFSWKKISESSCLTGCWMRLAANE